MAEGHFLSGLKQRRAEQMGLIQQNRNVIARLEAKERELTLTLGHIDALLRIEAPELRLEQIKPRKPRKPRDPSQAVTSKGGARVPITKAVLRLLRTEGSAMTVDEVVDLLTPDYPDLDRKKLIQNVRLFMSSRKNAGVLTSDQGRPLRYAIAALPTVIVERMSARAA